MSTQYPASEHNNGSFAITKDEVFSRMERLIDACPMPIVYTDDAYNLCYMNPASFTLFKAIEEHLPVKVEQMIGSNIDIFHKDPSHQRRMLADPSNFPIKSSLTIAGNVVGFEVVPNNVDGITQGYMVYLEVITEKVNFEQVLKSSASELKLAGEKLQEISSSLVNTTSKSSGEISSALASSSEVSGMIETVASSTEEMKSSIKEISSSSSKAAQIASEAVHIAEDTANTMSLLGHSSDEIGKVVRVINTIAEQTNLLALNATIEAARAGEAGKGFAVVANEVKELAKQTAQATTDISKKIDTIQNNVGDAVSAISKIQNVINTINETTITIASAIEEQTATTDEIARTTLQTSMASSSITDSLSLVAEVAESSNNSAKETKECATELLDLSHKLGALVDEK